MLSREADAVTSHSAAGSAQADCAEASELRRASSLGTSTSATAHLQNGEHGSPAVNKQSTAVRSTAASQRQHRGRSASRNGVMDPRQLTACITSTRHWTELQLLWLDHQAQLNAFHTTATATQLSKLVAAQGVAPSDRPELLTFATAVQDSVHAQASSLDARGLANCLWAIGALERAAPHASSSRGTAVAAIAVTLVPHLRGMAPQEVANAVWALGVLRQPPPASWTMAFEAATLGASNRCALGRMSAQELANTAWAMARMPGVAVSDGWLSELVACVGHRMSSFGAAELCSMMWALAALDAGALLPAAWLSKYHARLQQLAAVLGPQDISNTLLAWARLQLAPPPLLLQQLLQRAAATLPHFGPQALCNTLHSLASLNAAPSAAFMQQFLATSAAVLPRMMPQGLSALVWALAKLYCDPGPAWLAAFWRASEHHMATAGLFELSGTAWALGKLGCSPPVSWRAALLEASRQQLQEAAIPPAAASILQEATPACHAVLISKQQHRSISVRELVSLSSGLAGMGIAPDAQWQGSFLAASAQVLPGCRPHGLVGLLGALARLGMRPKGPWLVSFEAAALKSLASFTPRELSNLMWALAKLGVQPRPRLLQGICRAASTAAPQFNSVDGAMLCCALGRMRPQGVDQDWLRELVQDVQAAQRQQQQHKDKQQQMLQDCQRRDLMAPIWAFVRLRIAPDEDWLAMQLQQLQPLLPHMGPHAFVSCLVLLARLRAAGQPLPMRLGRPWLAAAGAAALPLLPLCSPGELASLLWALGRLHAWQGGAWMSAASTTVLATLPHFTGRELALAVAGLAKLGFQPGPIAAPRLPAAMPGVAAAADNAILATPAAHPTSPMPSNGVQPLAPAPASSADTWLHGLLMELHLRRRGTLTAPQAELVAGALRWWGVPAAMLPPLSRSAAAAVDDEAALRDRERAAAGVVSSGNIVQV